MKSTSLERDERTVAVENAGYRLSYHTLSFALLGLAAYRSLVRHEPTWDLLALVVLSGVLNTIYQGSHRVLHRRWVGMALATFLAAGLVALAMVALGIGR